MKSVLALGGAQAAVGLLLHQNTNSPQVVTWEVKFRPGSFADAGDAQSNLDDTQVMSIVREASSQLLDPSGNSAMQQAFKDTVARPFGGNFPQPTDNSIVVDGGSDGADDIHAAEQSQANAMEMANQA